LGERSFPRLTAPDLALDEPERLALRRAGLDLPGVAESLPEEMLLFYEVVTPARRPLVLRYPAVGEQGQALLPSSFLPALLECFAPGAVPAERRHMLLEGFDRDRPLSPAEYRVRAARAIADCSGNLHSALYTLQSPDLAANLAAAERVLRL